jgi:hypothetical protein
MADAAVVATLVSDQQVAMSRDAFIKWYYGVCLHDCEDHFVQSRKQPTIYVHA